MVVVRPMIFFALQLLCWLLVLASIAVVPGRIVLAGETVTNNDPLVRKAVLEAWQEYERLAQAWPKFAVHGRVWIDNKLTTQAWQVEKRNSHCRSLETHFIETGSKRTSQYGRLTCFNPDYAFELIRTSKESPWLIQQVLPDPAKIREYYTFKSLVNGRRVLCRIADIPFLGYIPDVLKLPDRVLYSLPSHDAEGRLDLVIENRSGTSGRRIEERIQVLRLKVNTKYHYLPEFVSWEVKEDPNYPVKVAAKGETWLRYRINSSRVAVPVAHEGMAEETTFDERTKQRTTRQVRFVNEYNLLDIDTTLPDSEFRLSYYGLPEPAELRGHKLRPWWLYILLTGLAFVVLGLGIYVWRRHRRAALA